jgi:4-hydroxy-tetrahydrodipicolinate synthase
MKLRGVVPVMLLPFHDDEGIDEASFRKEIDFAIAGGAAAVCAPGFATEFYKLTDAERYRVAQMLVEQTAGRVPAIVSTGAESVGADGLMVTPPKWCPLGLRELLLFYESVCRSVEIPIMIQDADYTGSGLPATLFVDLAERYPNVQFAKLEIPLPGAKAAEIIRLSEGRLQVLYGLGGVALMDGFGHGAAGVMPGTAMVEVYARVFQLFDAGRQDEARRLFYRVQPYLTFAAQHLELGMQLEKRVLRKRGVFPTERLREPTLHLDEAYQAQMDSLAEEAIAACAAVGAAARAPATGATPRHGTVSGTAYTPIPVLSAAAPR